MSFLKYSLLISALALVALSGCGSSSSTSIPSAYVAGPNVLEITVDGSSCNSATMYVNEPCTTITVCTPGTSQCSTISNILVDTGSYGLRIFSSALGSVTPSLLTDGSGNSYAECMSFGSGLTWGQVGQVSVQLASEPAVTVPIQVIDSNYATPQGSCAGNPSDFEKDPSVGFNGILGIGPMLYDCGTGCASSAANELYYSCDSNGNCAGAAVATDDQVQNPIALLPTDNNGVIIQLPSIDASGASEVLGGLVLGIGTQSNNSASAAVVLPADSGTGDFTTTFNGTTYSNSIFDTGSNGIFFSSTMSECSPYTWFCPGSSTSLSATIGASTTASFEIANYMDLLNNTDSAVFPNIGAKKSGGFTWGLPFFFGRNIYFGIEGKSSSLGSGPLYAY